jgi:hypothetical protein
MATIKFNDVVARIAVALDEPINDFAELLRVLRLTANDADDGRTFAWNGDSRLRDMFKRGYGPGSGIEVNAATISFVLVSYMLGSPRRTAAERALDLMFAVPPRQIGSRKQEVCPKTGERYFGAALAKTLSNRTLMNDLAEIMVCEDVGLVELIFASDVSRPDRMPLSTFYSERARKIKPGLQSSMHMRTTPLRFLPGLLNQREKTMA